MSLPPILRSLMLTILIFSFIESSPLFAVEWFHPKYQLQERKNTIGQVDRREGIKPIDITGEKLLLVSALLNVPDLKLEKSGNTYRLGFYLKKRENRVKLKVRDYNIFSGKCHYWMLPIRRKYGRGFQEFAWASGLAKELGVGLKDLGAVAMIGGYGHYIIAPLLLNSSAFSSNIRVRGCNFIFIPNETMTIHYRLYSRGTKSRTFIENNSEQWHKDQKAIIFWDGRDRGGSLASEGNYVLTLTAKILYLGRSAERITYDYEFFYKPEITYKSENP